jgi:ribosomal protein S18 acetylase RimI-like enzyme
MDHYSRSHGFGPKFEGGLATGIGDLVKRLDRPVNEVWSAVITAPQIQPRDGAVVVERIVGVVYVDGECSGQEGVARLRCFIVDESARGLGVGRKLLDAAMEFVREKGFRECQLSTLSSLTTARSMYEKAGFKPVGEKWLDTFEKGTMSVDYAWRRPESV